METNHLQPPPSLFGWMMLVVGLILLLLLSGCSTTKPGHVQLTFERHER